MQFEWDEDKALKNAKKHRVSFEQAQQVLMIRAQFPLRIWNTLLMMKPGT